DPNERISLVQRIAELCEKRLVDQPQAFVWWGRAFREQPMSELAGEELERLAKATHSWEETVGIYLDVLGASQESLVQRTALLRAARIYDEEMRDRVRAEEAYLRVLGLDEKDREALKALDRIYDQASMFGELADTLRRRIQVTDETDEVVELYFRL